MENYKKKYIVLLVMINIIAGGCSSSLLDEPYEEHNSLSRSLDETVLSPSDTTDYFWLENEKKFLQKVEGKHVVIYNPSKIGILHEKINGSSISLQSIGNATVFNAQENLLAANFKVAIIQGDDEDIAPILSDSYYSAPYYRMTNGKEVGLNNRFYVKLKDDADFELLNDFAVRNNVDIICKDEYLEKWFDLSCSKYSKGNALEMANLFQESGMFEYACPDLIGACIFGCIDEPLFLSGDLWHLDKINYCNSKDIISEGSSDVIVAVIDTGVDIYHRDFDENLLSGWDAFTQTAPNRVWHSHGTMVTGFIGAVPNNNQDVAGVGYGTKILPISIGGGNTEAYTPTVEVVERAFNYAINNGVKVINCSWSFDNPKIGDIVRKALDNDCVVVFSAGNENGKVGYPANSDSRVLVVGAINKDGERASFSNYGSCLDVVAPGEDVYCLYPGSGTIKSSGTSFAAPQVAGLAAMILSKYPELKPSEVIYRIEKTASKIGPYRYRYQHSQSFATRNDEMGYGLINMYAALAPKIPYLVTIKIKNLSSYMTMTAFRFDICNTNYQELHEFVIENKFGVLNYGEEYIAYVDLPPGKYIGEAVAESVGGIEGDCEFENIKGGTITFEFTGSTLDKLDWSTAVFEPAR